MVLEGRMQVEIHSEFRYGDGAWRRRSEIEVRRSGTGARLRVIFLLESPQHGLQTEKGAPEAPLSTTTK